MDNILYDLIKEGRKIEAVKYVKDKYGFGLKSAKETVDKLTEKVESFDRNNFDFYLNEELFKHDNKSEFSEMSDDDLCALIKEDKKLQATKYVKDKYVVDLKAVKKLVDDLDIDNPDMFTQKNIVSALEAKYFNENTQGYSYKLINGEQHYYSYKDGKKREVSRTSVPRDILEKFEKQAELKENRKLRRKNIFWVAMLVALIVGIYIYFN